MHLYGSLLTLVVPELFGQVINNFELFENCRWYWEKYGGLNTFLLSTYSFLCI